MFVIHEKLPGLFTARKFFFVLQFFFVLKVGNGVIDPVNVVAHLCVDSIVANTGTANAK